MLEVASPEQIQELPDIKTWLDWMNRVEDTVLHRTSAYVRRFVLDALLASAAQNELSISEKDYAKAKVRINTVRMPEDFDLYGDRRNFYVPTVSFRTYDDLVRLFMKMDLFFRSSSTLHIPAKLFKDDLAAGLTPFVPLGIRPVSTLLTTASGSAENIRVHTPFFVDPLVLARAPEDQILGKWSGLLNILNEPGGEARLIEELIADRTEYYGMVHPETKNVLGQEEKGMDPLEAELLKDHLDAEDINRLIQLNQAFVAKQEAEVSAFLAKPFSQRLGYQKGNGHITLTDELIAPIFNFLRTLKSNLSLSEAMSLLMRSPSLDALARELETKHPEIDIASAAYKDLKLVRQVLAGGIF